MFLTYNRFKKKENRGNIWALVKWCIFCTAKLSSQQARGTGLLWRILSPPLSPSPQLYLRFVGFCLDQKRENKRNGSMSATENSRRRSRKKSGFFQLLSNRDQPRRMWMHAPPLTPFIRAPTITGPRPPTSLWAQYFLPSFFFGWWGVCYKHLRRVGGGHIVMRGNLGYLRETWAMLWAMRCNSDFLLGNSF